jgi:hypothetical protein
VLFDVMIALFKYEANTQFMMYLVDSFGYTTSIAILFIRNFASGDLSWLEFFIKLTYVVSIVRMVLMVLDIVYYFIKYQRSKKIENEENSVLQKENEEGSSDRKTTKKSKETESKTISASSDSS